MLYEKLNPLMQETVDGFAEKVRPMSWQRTSDLLGEAAAPFAEQFEGEQARLASRGFLTAVLERLDRDTVTDPMQACLYLLSLNPLHRELAKSYLDDHPEMRQLVIEELGPEMDGSPDGS